MIVVTEAKMDNFARNVNALSRSYATFNCLLYNWDSKKSFYESVRDPRAKTK